MIEKIISKPVILKLASFMLVLFLPLILHGQDTRETVAILDFEGRGISQLESQTLTDRFRTAFASVGVFRLVERKMMEEELQEQGFQLKGCISYECAVEVGKLLGVQNMISGAVGMLGDKTWTIDMRMFSVQTGVN
ncbi:MAG TPA: CsgG/HfaB family protein, partial [Candidatus Marinimicrobia bacterium]|nr:CsgG/HfaB family protein [Candidatus Neomarinimicrobiota bacterium]